MLLGNQIEYVEVNYIKNLVEKIGHKIRKCYNLYYLKTLLNLIFTPLFLVVESYRAHYKHGFMNIKRSVIISLR